MDTDKDAEIAALTRERDACLAMVADHRREIAAFRGILRAFGFEDYSFKKNPPKQADRPPE